MSIHDFHQKFMSTTENNDLVESLRRLSQLEDPKMMFEGEESSEWVYWSGETSLEA